MEGNHRNVNRALREVNAFEWEGDYRPEAAKRLKALLEERMDEELEQYLGRGKHEHREEKIVKIKNDENSLEKI